MKHSWLFYTLITIMIWATTAAVSKMTFASMEFASFLLWMTLFCTLGLFVILLFQRKLHLLKSYTLKEHAWLFSLGALSMFLYNLFYFLAINSGSAVQANILNYTWPLWIVIFSVIILKEKAGLRTFLGILLSFVGIVIVVTRLDFTSFASAAPLPVIYALLGAAFWGLFCVLSKKVKFEAFSSMFFYSLYGLLLVFVYAIIKNAVSLPSFSGIIGTFYVGAVTTGIGFTFWIKALASGKTSIVANLAYLIPFLSLVFIYFLVGEKMYLMQLVGLVVIVLGILVQKR
ncbi:MAG: DMT family transporter [Candidatus Nanoarchaeia archaeon]|nr:DMT family transporter [Candidatus Nanoarchaeia archaeon]